MVREREGWSRGVGRNGKGISPDTIPLSDLVRGTFTKVGPRTPLPFCIHHIIADRCRDLYVTDDGGRFLGVITPSDILAHLGPGMGVRSRKKSHHLGTLLSRDDLCAEDIMSRGHIAVMQDTPLSEALRLMEKHHHPDLVVVNREGVLVGIVDVCSILSYLAGEGVS
ncbi:MAG: CBS domain-containing protein [Methanolinea sp.]|jgi:CBS domain-containing protein|nr:CBS domain-containing protein [Methanolinea sp.]